jgi:aryl-alcohol dehydrogenase-like predicted oxidoreductase
MGVLDRAIAIGPIGLGLAAVGRPAYINLGRDQDLGANRTREELERRAHDLMDAGFAAGVRYFDAARSYGLAESFLSSWLASRRPAREALVIGSKWGYAYTGDWDMDAPVQEQKDLSVERLRGQLDETRALLGDRLDLYQIHSATIESGVLEDDELIAELRSLRGSGVAIGFTATGARQSDTIDRALELELFDTVQATWNLHERSAGPALERAHQAGLQVIVKEALANGRLAEHAAPPQLRDAAQKLGIGPDALAIAAVIDQPWSDVVLSGPVSTPMLASNLRALELSAAPELGELAEPAELYWSIRSSLPWS